MTFIITPVLHALYICAFPSVCNAKGGVINTLFTIGRIAACEVLLIEICYTAGTETVSSTL